MHGEAADKPRYSFNFRVGLVKKRESREKEGREKKVKRRAHKKGKCSTRRGGRRRVFCLKANKCSLMARKKSLPWLLLVKQEKSCLTLRSDASKNFHCVA